MPTQEKKSQKNKFKSLNQSIVQKERIRDGIKKKKKKKSNEEVRSK